MVQLIIPIAIFFVGFLVIGVWSMKRTNTMGDFLLAGRKLGPWVSAFSQSASMMSGYSYTGAPGMAYTIGWPGMWYCMGEPLTGLTLFGLVGRRLRRMSALLGAITIPDFLEKRFGHPSVRIFGSIMVFIFVGAYLMAQFMASGKVLGTVFDLPYSYGVIIGAMVVLLYTFLGGYLAVAVTDFAQALIMWCFGFVVIIMAVLTVGGFAAMNNIIYKIDPDFVGLFTPEIGILFAVTILVMIGFGSIGNPHLAIRAYSLKSDRTAKSACIVSGLFFTIFIQTYYIMGIAALAYFGANAFVDPEVAAIQLWLSILPPFLAGFMVAAAMASIMSTSDSFLMVLVGTIMRDVIQRWFIGKKPLDDKKMVFYSRTAVFVITLAALMVALRPITLIFYIVIFAWGVLGISFGVAHIAALYWRKATWQGVLSQMIVGTLSCIVLGIVGASLPIMFGGAILLGIVVLVVVSLLTFRGISPQVDKIMDTAASYEKLEVFRDQDVVLNDIASSIRTASKGISG